MDPAEYRRVSLPYGQWTCADGHEVLFNRGYQPIYQRVKGLASSCTNHWVDDIVSTVHFYNDGWRQRYTLPRLIDHLEGILAAFQRGEDVSES